jgi:hypothetical protein
MLDFDLVNHDVFKKGHMWGVSILPNVVTEQNEEKCPLFTSTDYIHTGNILYNLRNINI